MEEPRQHLDYARSSVSKPTSVVGTIIKIAVAIVGAVLIWRLAMWRLFGNAPM